MPSWWGKPSSKDVKRKANKGSFIDAIRRKFRNVSGDNNAGKIGGSERYSKDTLSEKGLSLSRSEAPSLLASRCQSFNELPNAQPQPLPLPQLHVGGDDSGINSSALELKGFSKPSPLSRRSRHNKPLSPDAWGDFATASVSSNTSMDTDDQPDSRLLSPLASDYESGNATAINSPSSKMHKNQTPIVSQRVLRDRWKPVNLPSNNHLPPLSTRRGPLGTHMTKLQIPPRAGFFSAPDSSISSPRSPVSAGKLEQVTRLGFYQERPSSDVSLVASGHCSSPGSGQNSGHNSVGGDIISLVSPQSRCSPECSPIPSPKMTSPGPRVKGGSLTPLHRAGGFGTELPNERKLRSHRLPRPPVTSPSSCPFPSSYVTVTSPSPPRNPGRTESNISRVSRWKKGRLIGSGTYGRVYVGFNSETGEMCAMKEVILFSDDARSIESVQQLGQEITLLSRLKHPNIVRYLGSEMVDDKLYIYLEYVSGGSIHKLLREYGKLGESAIRSYTQQILSGLVYLHAKNTVHRDIKGANILVDPTGRVKLADFGMAKHMNGQPCPLSFKGSPYWMAPEVIRNSNGCNLAVDIWSLGCTVIEMATAKPPWSRYEGVAALFKIGNSKELPAIPDHLSEEGKDFVRQCLQRNPMARPTAVQLLQHPFIRNMSPFKRSLIRSEPPEPVRTITKASCYMDKGHNKVLSCLDSQGTLQLSEHRKFGLLSSDPCMPKHLSCPVSPVGSPLKSSQSAYRMRSPPPILSPHAASASSTPYTRGAFPRSHHFNQSVGPSGGVRTPQKSLYPSESPSCSKPRTEPRKCSLPKKFSGKPVNIPQNRKELNRFP